MHLTLIKRLAASLAICLALSSAASADQTASKRPLFLYVFIHDDIPRTERAALRKDYFAWLLEDLESFTGRRVYLEMVEDHPPLTQLQYTGSDQQKTLQDWSRHIVDYKNARNLPHNITSKYLLLTKHTIDEKTLGMAFEKSPVGIASLGSYTAAAHELGHMLGGTHEAAETLYKNAWWCETNMVATRINLRGNCYHYSDKNKEAIAAYLSEAP